MLVSLLAAGLAISMNLLFLVPVAAAAMLWGHYWDAENVMTIPSMVAAPRYRGVASGFGYIHNKLPGFLGIFLFPAFFTAIGPANATFLTAIFPLVGLLAAIFVLPEVYGYIEVRTAAARESAPSSSAPSTLSTVKPLREPSPCPKKTDWASLSNRGSSQAAWKSPQEQGDPSSGLTHGRRPCSPPSVAAVEWG